MLAVLWPSMIANVDPRHALQGLADALRESAAPRSLTHEGRTRSERKSNPAYGAPENGSTFGLVSNAILQPVGQEQDRVPQPEKLSEGCVFNAH
jgi:hypothetical protein